MFEKRDNFAFQFREYNLRWIDATKTSNFGRAKGGCIFAFKKELKRKYDLNFVDINGNIILKGMFEGRIVYFIPKYLNGATWGTDFEQLREVMEVVSESPVEFCILGDLNARIGDLQVLDEEVLSGYPQIASIRKSCDTVIDAKGKKLLEFFEDYGGIILNGRTVGDCDGELTFQGAMGKSVIDYCCCSVDFLKHIDKFSVLSKPYSDHMPICIKISANTSETNVVKSISLPQKLFWNARNLHEYQIKLNQFVMCKEFECCANIDVKTEQLKKMIILAANCKQLPKLFEPKQKWFDSQCSNARQKMFRNLRMFQKHRLEQLKLKYKESARVFKKICWEKKRLYENNILLQLNNVKNANDWWSLANSIKMKKFTIGTNITLDMFKNYFSCLLSLQAPATLTIYPQPFIVNPILDAPITLTELCYALSTAKDNKAPGLDRIPSEFYKNAPLIFLKEVASYFNNIFETEQIPNSFRQSVIVPIYKKGDSNEVSNYRGLSLNDALYKLFTNVLFNRISSWLDEDNVLNEFQAGFRKGYSTIDNIFNVSSIVHLNFKKKQKGIYFFC